MFMKNESMGNSVAVANGGHYMTSGNDVRKYFSESNRLIVPHLANDIMQEYRFITFADNNEILVYDNGIYVPSGRTVIRKAVQDKLERYARRSYGSEVEYFISNETKIDRSLVNRDKYLINFINGVYDISTDQFNEHSYNNLQTVQIPVTYNPAAKCPAINKFLDEVVSPEDKIVLLEFLGYCMIPDTKFETALMLVGSGSNGKSVFLNLVNKFIGYSNTSSVSLQSLATDKYSAANLNGKLVNIFPDLAKTCLNENNMFKALVTGDTLQAERKYENGFTFRNTAKLIFSANTVPAADDEYAYYRRWRIITFPNKFEGNKRNTNLIDLITTEEELSGLCNLALSSLNNLLVNNQFSNTKSVEDTRREYRLLSEPVSVFADECLIASINNTSKEEMLEACTDWCKKNGIKPIAKIELGRKLNDLGFQTIKVGTVGNRFYAWEKVSIRSK